VADTSAGTPVLRVETGLVYAHGLAALVTLLVSVAFGLVAALELLYPDLAGDTAWLSWGRVRYAHTQGIMLGWLGNAFLAFLYYVIIWSASLTASWALIPTNICRWNTPCTVWVMLITWT
jgi:cbb3-type cytochrome oxidase subunit 1